MEAGEKPATESTPAAGGTNGKTAGQRGFKYWALREALRELGHDAKNADLADHIRSRYGAEAVPANISVAKSNILKKLREGKRKGRKPGRPPKVEAAPEPAAAGGDSFSLEDLRRVKDLAARLGKDRLKEAADLVG